MKMNICPLVRTIIEESPETKYLTRYIDNLSSDEMLLLLVIEHRKSYCKKNENALRAIDDFKYLDWVDKINSLSQVEDKIEKLILERTKQV